MIVSLKDCMPYMINSSLETKINAAWLHDELIDCLGILFQSAFNVRDIRNLLQHFNHDPDKFLSLFGMNSERYISFMMLSIL